MRTSASLPSPPTQEVLTSSLVKSFVRQVGHLPADPSTVSSDSINESIDALLDILAELNKISSDEITASLHSLPLREEMLCLVVKNLGRYSARLLMETSKRVRAAFEIALIEQRFMRVVSDIKTLPVAVGPLSKPVLDRITLFDYMGRELVVSLIDRFKLSHGKICSLMDNLKRYGLDRTAGGLYSALEEVAKIKEVAKIRLEKKRFIKNIHQAIWIISGATRDACFSATKRDSATKLLDGLNELVQNYKNVSIMDALQEETGRTAMIAGFLACCEKAIEKGAPLTKHRNIYYPPKPIIALANFLTAIALLVLSIGRGKDQRAKIWSHGFFSSETRSVRGIQRAMAQVSVPVAA